MRFLLTLVVSVITTALLCLVVLYLGLLNPFLAFLLFPVGVLSVLIATDAV